ITFLIFTVCNYQSSSPSVSLSFSIRAASFLSSLTFFWILFIWSSTYVKSSGLRCSRTYQQFSSLCPLRSHAGHRYRFIFLLRGLSLSVELVAALFRFGAGAASEGVSPSSGSPANSVLKALPLAIIFEVFFRALLKASHTLDMTL